MSCEELREGGNDMSARLPRALGDVIIIIHTHSVVHSAPRSEMPLFRIQFIFYLVISGPLSLL